ncbi:HTH cro/C1-type domain-containing protein [Tenacibaculum sp. 190130A14a]|uniref:HTH cro/C1-type domain-containing protein n=1 Tax=Tenacibaculum polynesiense TaxID=3137857 RepID=A0ABM9P6M0_9FLAO
MVTSKRIEKIIEVLGLNNSSFAKKLGVSSTTIDGYTKGRRNSKKDLVISQPNFDVIKKMVETFNINADYVLGVSDDIFITNRDSLAHFSIEEIITFIFDNKEKFRENTAYKLLMENEFKEQVLEKLKKDKLDLLAKRDKLIND